MEALAKVEVQVNDNVIIQTVERKIDDHLIPSLRMVTEKQLCKMYSMSQNELAPLLFDAKVRIYERRKGARGKRRWFYPEVQQALDEVINENF
ncbi:hypothetical protein AAGS61_05760 [Lysinibacillus sp. KU-BSD001]|uniref:hypothetical protein n=1 Tax=Lysinibacillus sp. KU-BSD001 TaxID=3141328 RepID=UPI0036E26DC9